MSRRLTLCILTLLAIPVFTPSVPAQAEVQEVISGLSNPVRLVAPAGDPRLFVVQRNGLIRIFDQQGAEQDTFLNISDQTTTSNERGLLGLAFPPDYSTTGRFYVNFTNLQGDTQVARYLVSATDADRADPGSQEIILTVDQPASNHNGGHLEFGPDGLLYIGLGDGGGFDDLDNNAQNDQLLLGKMLRLDVGVATGYAIPDNNPFIGQTPRDEIWASGLRNPWGFSFDSVTGDLYIADVGQNIQEEIDVQPAASTGGENYGWRLMEGVLCFNPASDCNDGSLTLPVHTYDHGAPTFRCSITGGYVYRGTAVPELVGQYVFADYCSDEIWSLIWTEAEGVSRVFERSNEMTPPSAYGRIAALGQDGLGEMYILDLTRGRAYRIVGASSNQPDVPTRPFLAQNFPNPFNPRTEIAFAVARPGGQVKLLIHDVAGHLVRTLVDTEMPAGEQTVVWDGTDDGGRRVESGLYLYRLDLDGTTVRSRKMTLLK